MNSLLVPGLGNRHLYGSTRSGNGVWNVVHGHFLKAAPLHNRLAKHPLVNGP